MHDLSAFANHLPFVSLVVKGRPTPVTTRLLEMAIMVFASTWVTIKTLQQDIAVIDTKIEFIIQANKAEDARMDTIESDAKTVRKDFYSQTFQPNYPSNFRGG